MTEKTEMRIDNHPDGVNMKKIKRGLKQISKNPWAISTIVISLVALVLIVYLMIGTGLSGEKAGSKLVEFLNQQTNGGVEYVMSEDLGDIYEVTVAYQGQEIPIYVTKKGDYFIQAIVPLDESVTNMSEDNSNNQPTQPVNVPKSDKPTVELFIMSHCPYGTQAEKGMIPVLELLGDKVDWDIRFVYYAMHGEKEVNEQLNQYCIQKEQKAKYLDYLKCFLGKTGSESDGDVCLTEAKIDINKLSACTAKADKDFEITANLNDKSKWLSGYYPLFNIDKELNDEYQVGGSPTFILNGQDVSSGRDSASYFANICNAFNNAPEECSQTLSSATPSPGFGYSTTTDTNNAAQCG